MSYRAAFGRPDAAVGHDRVDEVLPGDGTQRTPVQHGHRAAPAPRGRAGVPAGTFFAIAPGVPAGTLKPLPGPLMTSCGRSRRYTHADVHESCQAAPARAGFATGAAAQRAGGAHIFRRGQKPDTPPAASRHHSRLPAPPAPPAVPSASTPRTGKQLDSDAQPLTPRHCDYPRVTTAFAPVCPTGRSWWPIPRVLAAWAGGG
jgi:hypothetical protein